MAVWLERMFPTYFLFFLFDGTYFGVSYIWLVSGDDWVRQLKKEIGNMLCNRTKIIRIKMKKISGLGSNITEESPLYPDTRKKKEKRRCGKSD